MTGNKDDRHFGTIFGNHILKLEATEPREGYIQYQTTRSTDPRTVEERLRGLECFRLPPGPADQGFQRFTHRDVIVDDKDNRNFLRFFSFHWSSFLKHADR